MQRKTGSSDHITRAYLDSLLLEVRHLDSVMPDTGMDLFGCHFDTPVMTAALSHLHNTRENGMAEFARGAAMANAVCFSGMGPEKELEGMIDTGAKVVKIIKTYQDRDSIYRKIRHAENYGALAVGMDIDHAFSHNGYDCIEGMEMRPLSTEELKDFVKSTKLPFVIKGVLSVQDALKCKEAGVKGIVVSHHNGRLQYALPPLMVLPEIMQAVGNSMEVFVDCSLESGIDVYKCLALGAKACCIGRPLMKRLGEKGAEGVREGIEAITRDLRYTMAMTCAKDLKSIDPTVMRMGSFTW